MKPLIKLFIVSQEEEMPKIHLLFQKKNQEVPNSS